jgi:UDP-hydrolysing UDP-N-acetyl-D-glucosamine 2-epimerase
LAAPAIATAYQNCLVAHGEGGEHTGTIDQKVRQVITQLADIHFPVTETAAQRIIRMGADPEKVFTVGSTALDTIADTDLTNDRTEPYILVLHHPNTTHPENPKALFEAIRRLDIHVVWVNPNVDAGSKALLKQIHKENVEFVKDLSSEEYAKLLYNCRCAVGNSSSFIKEGGFLGVPAVTVGRRQEGREHGENVIFVDYDREAILEAIATQMRHGKYPQDFRFGDGTAGKKIAEILAKI